MNKLIEYSFFVFHKNKFVFNIFSLYNETTINVRRDNE